MLRYIMDKIKRRNSRNNISFAKRYSKYHSSRRLTLEHLEDRELLSGNYTWVGGTSGSWANLNNWYSGVAPSGSDNVLYFNNASSPNKVMSNDLSAGVSFSYIGFGASGYSIAQPSNPINLAAGAHGSGSINLGASGINIGINTGLVLSSGNHQISTSSGSASLTISGSISDQDSSSHGGLEIVGSITLTLSGANTYSGGTTISNGTLQIGATNSLPTGGIVNLANTSGAILSLNGYNQEIFSLSGGGIMGATSRWDRTH